MGQKSTACTVHLVRRIFAVSAVGLRERSLKPETREVSGLEFETELLEVIQSDRAHDLAVALDGDPDMVEASDSRGFTLLHYAALNRARGCADVLIDRGAPLDARNRWGNSPLWVAVMSSQGHEGVISTLLQRGADPGAANNHGRTPRQMAELIANYDVAQFFPHAE